MLLLRKRVLCTGIKIIPTIIQFLVGPDLMLSQGPWASTIQSVYLFLILLFNYRYVFLLLLSF